MSHSLLSNNGRKIAYVHTPGANGAATGVFFCGGFKSSMQGLKALALETFCKTNNFTFTRFDYSGHGSSDGEFTDGDIGTWLSDALCVFDQVTPHKAIVIGSSMGAWIATLLAQQRTNKLAGLITIAAAPDFTEKLLLPALSTQQRNQILRGETIDLASDYDDGSPYPISAHLIEQSRAHCVLNDQINLPTPVRLLHGTNDQDVPYSLSIELMQAIQSDDVQLTLIKDADHRLSSDADIHTITTTLQSLLDNK